MENRLSGHSVYRTQYHVAWTSKYRRRILNPGLKGYYEKIQPKILRQMPGMEIEEQNILVDHIHSIMIIPMKYVVSAVVGRLKGQSARMMRKKFDWMKKE